jgi:tetratricopeptide (TPR) repeat protein
MKYLACLCFCSLMVWAAATQQASVIFDQAVQQLSVGNYAAAEQGFQTVLRQQPGHIGAIGNLGIIYARTNRTDQAIREYKRALRLSPDDVPILLNLGIVYLKQESHALALPYFARVVAIDPQHRQARQLLAVCRLYTGQLKQAIHDLEDLKVADPHDEQLLFLLGFAYLKNGEPDKAQAIFNEMFEVAGPARAQFLLGRACYEAALFPRAEESYLAVQRLDSNYPGLHVELGKVYISERRTDDAIHELKVALQENGNDEDAAYFLGGLLVQEGRFEEGVPYLEQAKKLKPDSWAIYLYLGRAKLKMGQNVEAIGLLQRAVELNPDDATALYQLGRALQGEGRKAEAARVLSRARELKTEELNSAVNELKIPGVR